MRDLTLLLSLITIPFFVSGQTQYIEVLPGLINSKGLDYAKYEINIAKTEFDIYGIYNLSQKQFDEIVNYPDDFEILNSTETELTGKLKVEKNFSRSFFRNELYIFRTHTRNSRICAIQCEENSAISIWIVYAK